MSSHTSLSRQIIGSLILFSIASLFLVCVAGPFMMMADMGQETDCGMAHTAALCPMTLSGQLSFWQQIIVPASSPFAALALLAFLATLAFFWNSSAALQAIQSRLKPAYFTDPPSLFDNLRQQFSQGILHPKIY